MSAGEAFVTLVTTDSYCQGAMVLARSLRRHGTTRHIVIMVTPNISEKSRLALENVFDEVFTVDLMDSKDQVHLSVLGRPELGVTYTKIHCWTLTQYSKCVFLDADTLVLCNVDELFHRDELSAAPDPGWPDCFNSGVFVFRPSLLTHSRLLDHALHHGSFDGGDQGLLNSFFSSWPVEDISKHLPFIYNLCASTIYSYLPAFQQFGHNAKIVHFAGAVKPWSSQTVDSNSYDMERFTSLWWKEFHHATPPAPETQPCPDRQQQQIHEQEVEMPFRQNLDTSNSLLAHFSPPSKSPPSHTEETTCFHTDRTPSVETSASSETTEVMDPPLGDQEEDHGDAIAEVMDPPSGDQEEDHGDAIADTDAQPSTSDSEVEHLEHRRLWEAGQVDYLGRDAFQNIQRMLDRFLD
ncbi:glycogenin-2 [Austrofundulus limnaeus]|uniref:glycogenin glucosyltransferase n=1 Tax=Austrofundulus limnaeus TaxID=52670 RepID=A0A2I4D7B6_AUSLI|nr:PREDICTED: glycogenin-1-like [Austrofundulus limnaeus]